jgi:hypothetical protein
MKEVDAQTRSFIQMAVQGLAVQMGDPYGDWHLQQVLPLEELHENHQLPIYRVQIIVHDHICFWGIAIWFSEHEIEIMLNSQSVYTLLQGYIDKQLATYTREHPWIVGI